MHVQSMYVFVHKVEIQILALYNRKKLTNFRSLSFKENCTKMNLSESVDDQAAGKQLKGGQWTKTLFFDGKADVDDGTNHILIPDDELDIISKNLAPSDVGTGETICTFTGYLMECDGEPQLNHQHHVLVYYVYARGSKNCHYCLSIEKNDDGLTIQKSSSPDTTCFIVVYVS